MTATKMTATKMLSYNNRRLQPGEDFEAKSQRDLKVLLASRKAKIKRQEASVPPPPATVAAEIEKKTVLPEDELAQARADYKQATGKQPYYGWDVADLREKIEAAAEAS